MFILPPLETGGGYTPPGVDDFRLEGGFIPGVDWFNKPLVQAIIATILVILLWWLVARRLKIVPSKSQFLAENVYDLVRNGIARDILGHDFRKYLPYLLALFSFLLINNWFGIFAPFMFPTFSNIGYAYAFAVMSWVIYNGAGIAKHGLGGYLKNSLIPAGVPLWLVPIIMPIEFLSNFIVRPVTLALRLFANLFAGHLVVLVFVVGGAYLLTQGESLFYRAAGGVAYAFSFAIFALEILIGALQAYVFTVLTASYVQSATADEH
ncbi:MAG: F0F1 ATP synthase subunit A [Propionibacteriaceae bacterium]|nr:F0F1 ATP synthase subunit A [Propionibacteriaceae bacterium]